MDSTATLNSNFQISTRLWRRQLHELKTFFPEKIFVPSSFWVFVVRLTLLGNQLEISHDTKKQKNHL